MVKTITQWLSVGAVEQGLDADAGFADSATTDVGRHTLFKPHTVPLSKAPYSPNICSPGAHYEREEEEEEEKNVSLIKPNCLVSGSVGSLKRRLEEEWRGAEQSSALLKEEQK
ncbi:unnamed protein product [Pleuronectes platessa]|uniref:Uncharacterized protein n=1 Tax=Pleuronectes platessa TaxID=8262 RepID=A0A9N7Z3J7_PLEPL|nr:unnamed protein product [Pleuronectes platessa]